MDFEFEPTPEQKLIQNAAFNNESMLITAGAGAAKTTTLKLLAAPMYGKRVLAVAFNKRIVEDLQKALPETVAVKTLNGLGHAAWRKQRGRSLTLDMQKLTRLTTAQMKLSGVTDEDGSLWGVVRDLTRELKNARFIPEDPQFRPQLRGIFDIDELLSNFAMDNEWDHSLLDEDQLLYMANQILVEDIKEGFACNIDFDDQIYLTTTFFCPYPQYDIVLVDESQDLSPANHIQLTKTKPKQFIAVGDPRQAIYAFRGADSNSMTNLKSKVEKDLNLTLSTYPLNTSFRCPKRVVARQQLHYPGFVAFEGNPEGSVLALPRWGIMDIPEGAAVICRNNSPLINLAFSFIRQRRGFNYFGEDMAKNLKGLIKKIAGFAGKQLNNSDKATSKDVLLARLRIWYMEEQIRLESAGRSDRLEALRDKMLCARLIIKQCEDLGSCMEMCDQMFGSATGTVVLTTGHRSKGFEWKDVFHLDPFRIPSKFALEARDRGSFSALNQEMNLKYVIETRTKLNLTMINLKDNQDIIEDEEDEV